MFNKNFQCSILALLGRQRQVGEFEVSLVQDSQDSQDCSFRKPKKKKKRPGDGSARL